MEKIKHGDGGGRAGEEEGRGGEGGRRRRKEEEEKSEVSPNKGKYTESRTNEVEGVFLIKLFNQVWPATAFLSINKTLENDNEIAPEVFFLLCSPFVTLRIYFRRPGILRPEPTLTLLGTVSLLPYDCRERERERERERDAKTIKTLTTSPEPLRLP